MSDLKITLVQTQQFWEDKEKNLAHLEQLVSGLGHAETDVLIFPEMFQTGFTMNTKKLSEPMDNAPSIHWLKKKSETLGCLCIASLIIEQQGQYFNRMVACFPDGYLEYYDKIHLFSLAKEDQYFTPGNSKKIIKYKGWRIMLQICYDLRFPETGRNSVALNKLFDYDVLLYVANWPEKRISHWNALLPARAIENQSYVVAVNRVGTDKNQLTYTGCSQVIAPNGNYLIAPIQQGDILLSTTLNQDFQSTYRTQLSFLKDQSLN